jgi:hypothetical protein
MPACPLQHQMLLLSPLLLLLLLLIQTQAAEAVPA